MHGCFSGVLLRNIHERSGDADKPCFRWVSGHPIVGDELAALRLISDEERLNRLATINRFATVRIEPG
jgi:hypothetical protein